MDCEGCTDRLIDLLYGEIDDADAEAARAHLDGCEACAGAFERVSAGHELATMLVIEEPPPSVLESVMAAARERAGRVSAKPEPPVAHPAHVVPREAREREEDDEGGIWSSLMRWLASFAMGPQAAMATMLLLMVGIGLWYLPDWRGIDLADTHAIVDPAGDDVSPSAGLVPAEPLALEEDPHRARIRPRGADEQPVPAPSRARPAAPPPPVEASPPVRERVASAELRAPRDEAADEAPQLLAQAAEPALMEGQALAMDRPSEVAPSATPPPSQQAFAQPPPPRAMATPAGAAPSAPAVAGAPRAEPSSQDMLPPAIHQLARNQAAANSCPQAISTYERLLARYPSYPRASEARVELADCYRRTGRLTQARRSLEDASRDPRISSRAQRELVRLEAAERAMDRQRTQTERTPDPPAARSTDDEYEATEPSY